MIDIYAILRQIQEEKSKRGIRPAFVTLTEILKRIDDDAIEELRNLVKNKKVKHHETLNSHAFSIYCSEIK